MTPRGVQLLFHMCRDRLFTLLQLSLSLVHCCPNSLGNHRQFEIVMRLSTSREG